MNQLIDCLPVKNRIVYLNSLTSLYRSKFLENNPNLEGFNQAHVHFLNFPEKAEERAIIDLARFMYRSFEDNTGAHVANKEELVNLPKTHVSMRLFSTQTSAPASVAINTYLGDQIVPYINLGLTTRMTKGVPSLIADEYSFLVRIVTGDRYERTESLSDYADSIIAYMFKQGYDLAKMRIMIAVLNSHVENLCNPLFRHVMYKLIDKAYELEGGFN